MLCDGKHWEARNFLKHAPLRERYPTLLSAAWGVGVAFLCKLTPYDVMMSLAKPGHEEYNVYG